MKYGLMKKAVCLVMMLVLLCGSAWAESAQGTAESALLRVLLRSLGNPAALDITLNGSYCLNGNEQFRFDEQAKLRVIAAEDEVWLSIGGMHLNMGEELTLTRGEASYTQNGLYIEGSQRGKLYRGSLRVTVSDGVLQPILLIDLEEYLYGVVPYEMSDSYPLEALKAQAVAARTYALQRRADRAGRAYDVVDTTADQVFMGYDPSYTNAIAAVDATRGVCGIYNGKYATCYYTATNGGQTAMAHDILGITSDDGYLAIVDDPYDLENPGSQVKSMVIRSDAYALPDLFIEEMKAAAAERLSAMNYSDERENIFIDEIVDITPHTPLAGEPNRMYQYLTVTFKISACPMIPIYSKPTSLDFIHALFGRNTYEPKLIGEEEGDPVLLEEEFTCEIGVYDQLKDELGMKISNIDCELVSVLREQDDPCDIFVIQMRRYGHGVGMSQRGAQWMAKEYGKTHEEILSFYYPGLTFEARAFVHEELIRLDVLPAGVGNSSKPAPQQKELPSLEEGEHYAVVVLSTAASTLNLRSAPSTDSQILTTLSGGWRVIVMSEADGWAHVRTADHEGYVSSQYLAAEESDE